MRTMILCLLALAAGGSLPAHHQGDTGSSSATSAVLTPHLLASGDLSVDWGWQYVAYPLLSTAELESKVRALSRGDELTVRDSVSTQVLDLGYGVNRWLQADVALRSVRTERLREGHLHADGSFGAHEFGNPAGLANTELRLKARLAHGDGWSLAGIAGGTLPTGQDGALTDGLSVDATADTATGKVKASPKFSYLGAAYQPGSGATTATLALAASREFGLWESDASLMAVLPAAARGFKAGNSLAVGLAAGRLFGEGGHEAGFAGLEFSAVQSEPSNTDGVGAQDGGLSASVGARLRVPVGARGLAVLGAALPLLQPADLGPAPLAVLNISLQLGL